MTVAARRRTGRHFRGIDRVAAAGSVTTRCVVCTALEFPNQKFFNFAFQNFSPIALRPSSARVVFTVDRRDRARTRGSAPELGNGSDSAGGDAFRVTSSRRIPGPGRSADLGSGPGSREVRPSGASARARYAPGSRRRRAATRRHVGPVVRVVGLDDEQPAGLQARARRPGTAA